MGTYKLELINNEVKTLSSECNYETLQENLKKGSALVFQSAEGNPISYNADKILSVECMNNKAVPIEKATIEANVEVNHLGKSYLKEKEAIISEKDIFVDKKFIAIRTQLLPKATMYLLIICMILSIGISTPLLSLVTGVTIQETDVISRMLSYCVVTLLLFMVLFAPTTSIAMSYCKKIYKEKYMK